MTHAEAVEVIRAKYPSAVVRKVWNPKAGRNWFKVISTPIAWQGGLDGHFSHVDLSVSRPTITDAVKYAAEALARVIS